MNPWFRRMLAVAEIEMDGLSHEEARIVLELAGITARTAGARPFAPLATYLAGRAAAAAGPAERLGVLRRLTEAAAHTGAAEEELGL